MYFDNVHTPGEAKSLYRKLAKMHHPDLHGHSTTATMQAINAEYHATLERLDGHTSTGSDGKEHTYHYKADVEQAIIDKITDLLKLQMSNVNIELIGTWIWISGDTKPHKESLKELDCIWHNKRRRWYWRQSSYKRKYSNANFDTLRQMYGSRTFETSEESIATA